MCNMTGRIIPARKRSARVSIDQRNVAIIVRVNSDDHERFKRCAEHFGVSLSGWVRMTLLEEARRHEKAGK